MLLVAILGGCASAGLPAPSDALATTTDAYRPPASEPAVAHGAAAGSSSPRAESSMPAVAQANQYAVSTMYYQRHGEYARQSKPFRADAELSFEWQPDTRIKGEQGHFDILGVRLDLLSELPVDPDTALLLGGVVEAKHMDFTRNVVGADGNEYYDQLSLRLGAQRFFSDEFLLSAMFEPGVWSDLDGGPNSNDWQFYGEMLGTYQVHPSVFLKLGVKVSNTFRDVPVYAVLGVSWLPIESVRVDVLLPHLVEVSFNPDPNLILSTGISLDGEEYNTRSPVALGANEFEQTTQELRLYFAGRYRFNDYASMFGRFGTTLAGDYQLRGSMGNSDGVLQPAAFLELGLGWDF